jgi:hypothetical protein
MRALALLTNVVIKNVKHTSLLYINITPTFSIMTICITTLSIMTISTRRRKCETQHKDIRCSCRVSQVVMLRVIMLKVVMLNVMAPAIEFMGTILGHNVTTLSE